MYQLPDGGFEDEGEDFPSRCGIPRPVCSTPAQCPRFCENGFHNVFGVVELPPQSRGDHVHGFGEADVADFLLCDEALKFFNGEASTYFLLEGGDGVRRRLGCVLCEWIARCDTRPWPLWARSP